MMTGGQPDRNGTVSAGLPMPIVAWHMTLHRDRSDEETANSLISSRQSQSASSLVPKLEARMIGDIVWPRLPRQMCLPSIWKQVCASGRSTKMPCPFPSLHVYKMRPDADDLYLAK